MAKLAGMQAIDGAADSGEVSRIPRLRTRYYAFLSYSHQDKELADWLHRELEKFRVPYSIAGKLTANGVVPRRLTPIFRDEQDLSAGGDLAQEIKAALAGSQFLIVLCSPMASKSRWTNQEIESFKRTRPEGCVLAAVVQGEPFASDIPGREAEECFPPALRYKYDRRGHQTEKRAEPLAADFRATGEGRRLAFLKLVAGMLGVGLDELVQRETTRRHRQLAWLAAGSLAGMAVTSTLAVAAFQARNEAREQRREAEGLIGFMLGDLKAKLEPIGKLDALDGVGTRVLAYYHQQDTSRLSDQGLAQRSKALTLMGQIADARGKGYVALAFYREAYAGTAEALRRKPDDPQRLYEHAQNVFYIGNSAQLRGDLASAITRMQEYKRLSEQMVALDPNNMRWRMEVQFAETDLGTLYLNQRRYSEATAQFEQALQTIKAITALNPQNAEYQQAVPEAMAWLADAQFDKGNLADAIAIREQHVGLLERKFRETNDIAYRQKLIPAHRGLGILYAGVGQLDRAIAQLKIAAAQADFLIPYEPDNTLWVEFGFRSKIALAELFLLNGAVDASEPANEGGCAMVAELLGKNPKNPTWLGGSRDCWLMRAQIALARGKNDDAVRAAIRASQIAKSVRTADPALDSFLLAKTNRVLGDAYRAAGNAAAAQGLWMSAYSAIPHVAAETPWELRQHALVLERVGRSAEANAITAKLNSMGYRRPS